MKLITEQQVKNALSIRQCIEVLRDAFGREFVNIPRYRLKSQNSLLHVMSASIPSLNIMGLKTYGTSRESNEFAVVLFEEKTGKIIAVFQADALGQIRTGAASGLATDFLARDNAEVGAVIGTGYQADAQLLAIDAVRALEEIRIYSRKPENRASFIERVKERARAKLVDAASAEECVDGADIICTITSSRGPVLQGQWLRRGVHINAAGSNRHGNRELDRAAVDRCDLVVVDHLEQSRIESGDLIQAFGEEHTRWENVVELKDVVQGKVGRTSPEQITLFKSNGIAMEDVASAWHVYSRIYS